MKKFSITRAFFAGLFVVVILGTASVVFYYFYLYLGISIQKNDYAYHMKMGDQEMTKVNAKEQYEANNANYDIMIKHAEKAVEEYKTAYAIWETNKEVRNPSGSLQDATDTLSALKEAKQTLAVKKAEKDYLAPYVEFNKKMSQATDKIRERK